MPQVMLSDKNHSYIHHDQSGPSQAIDVHDIFSVKSRVRVLLSYLGTLLCLSTFCYILLAQDKVCISSVWSTFLCILFAKSLQYKPVKKESVVIFPEFGVQLETHLWSGRVIHRFVPIGKILRPVINECVTPVTCYWSLALILRDEVELMLVFKELRPPMKMLVPVWRALRFATDCRDSEKHAVLESDTS